MLNIKSILIFLMAGFLEIGGGYFVWIWLRESKSVLFGLLGAAMLILYGPVSTMQPSGFGRTYAAYGGIFIFLSLLWGWIADKTLPDKYDLLGAMVALSGACIIFYAPRKIA